MLFYMFMYTYVESRPLELKHFQQTTVFVLTEQMHKDCFSSNNSPLRLHLHKLILISFNRRPLRKPNRCTEPSKRAIHWYLRSQKNMMVSSLIRKVKHDKIIRTKAQWVCTVHRSALWVSPSLEDHSRSKSHSHTCNSCGLHIYFNFRFQIPKLPVVTLLRAVQLICQPPSHNLLYEDYTLTVTVTTLPESCAPPSASLQSHAVTF